jgi:hypothetical protein
MNVVASTIIQNAVALNNMGVALLDNGYYNEALITLQDALRIVQKSIPRHEIRKCDENSIEEKSPIQSKMIVDTINQVYDLAFKRFLLTIQSKPFLQQHYLSTSLRYDVNTVTWSITGGCSYSILEFWSKRSHVQDTLNTVNDILSKSSNELTFASRQRRSAMPLFSVRIQDIPLDHGTANTNDQPNTTTSTIIRSILSKLKEYNFEFSLIMNNIAVAELLLAEAAAAAAAAPDCSKNTRMSRKEKRFFSSADFMTQSRSSFVGRNQLVRLHRHATIVFQAAANLGLNDTLTVDKIIAATTHSEDFTKVLLQSNYIIYPILDCLKHNWVAAIASCCCCISDNTGSLSLSNFYSTTIRSLMMSIRQNVQIMEKSSIVNKIQWK